MKQTLLQQIEEEMARLEEEMLLGDVSTQSFDLVNNTSVQDNILSPKTKVQDFGIQYKDVLGKPKKYDGILTKNDNFVVSAGMFNLKRTNESESNNDQWFDIIVNGNKVGKYGLSFYNDIKAIGIGDLEIYPEYRNKGYGTRTIKDIISKYKNTADLIYCFVDKDNTDAIRLYKRLGTVSDKSNTSQKVGEYEWRNPNGQYYVEFYNRNKSLTKENYERPWSLEEIKMYVPDKYEELSKCPIHRWRAESGIELIHKEPTRDELDRIWKNWNLMPKEMQNISDKKSIELFGITNAENYKKLTAESTDTVITEGKHWPEDYKKTAINMIKAAPLGQTTWYSTPLIELDVNTIANEFGPLSHKNSNLGYFSTIIKWFIEYTGTDKNKYQEFIERKLDEIIQTLLYLSNNSTEEIKIKDDLKTKWKFSDFEEYAKKIQSQISQAQQEKSKNLTLVDKGYDIIPIRSYEELNKKFGGYTTGYRGQSEWCHTNGESTYNSWVDNGTKMFFVLAKKGWENIRPPVPNTTTAYDEYGISLIAILVDVFNNKLLNATLRWNHIIEPNETVPGTSVDRAFLGWADLDEAVGIKVEDIVKKQLKEKREEQERNIKDANAIVEEILKGIDTISTDAIPTKYRHYITEIKIPSSITSIGNSAFSNCRSLTQVTIPDSVTSIGRGAFEDCSSLTSFIVDTNNTNYSSANGLLLSKDGKTLISGINGDVVIPNSVIRIRSYAFSGCDGLMSITIPDSVTSILEGAFGGCSGLTSINIPNSVTSISDYAFDDCDGLISITIPNSVISILPYAFEGCSSLKSIIIPNSVMNIRSYAFSHCDSLMSIIIPDSVTRIDYGAFYRCNPNIVVTVSKNFDANIFKEACLPKTAKIKIVDNINESSKNYFIESDIQGFEHMSLDELKDLILDGIHDRMIENDVTDYEAKILNMAIIGSRNRHTAKSDSDLDVVLEYSGKMREDDLFDILHSETEDGEFEIDGIAIDVNPIRAQQTGTLEDYLNKSKKYDEYVLSKVKLNETKKKRKKRNYRQYGAFYPYWPIFPIHPPKPDKPDSEPEDITPDGGETDIGDIGGGIDAGGIGESEIQTNLGKILLTEATHEQAMNYMRKILKHWKTNIIEIVFTKKSTGATRKIRVHFDEDFVKNACNGGNDEIVKQIRATNKERDNMIVCEMLPNRKYQFRTIPLRNVKSLKIKDYKTWRYTKHGDVSDINLK